MPVATTTEAGRQVLSDAAQTVINNATAERAARIARARQAADTLTPLDTVGRAPLATVPEPPVRHVEKPAATFTIHALIDDFPFDVCFTGSAEQLAATIKRLRDLGAVPPTPAARADVEAEKERSAPVCEFHGPMKESSKRPGTFYCPAKMGDNSYCKSNG